MNVEPADVVIVGAGAAGCVLASRLSEDPSRTIILLEAGPDQRPGEEHWAIRDPWPVSLSFPEFSWPDLTAEVGPDRGDGTPRFSRRFMQGLGVGGGSNIQGMIAIRGYPADYDAWVTLGASGWGWEDVLPYFKRLETDLDFDGPMHGADGPIPIRRVAREEWAPFSRAFADCMLARGYPFVADFNADFRAGVGPTPMANLPDRRISAATGYLTEEVRRRPNLRIVPDCRVERIRLEHGQATGAVARTRVGLVSFSARETIISAGAIHSPALLMRSGIGPAGHLRDLQIGVVRDLPGVGQNLMNHVGVGLAVHLPRHAVQPRRQRSWGQSRAHVSSGVDGDEDDLALVAINKSGWHALGRRIGLIGVEVHKVHSRGTVRLRDAAAASPPEVKFNLLSDRRDAERLERGLRLCLEILADARMAPVMDEPLIPNMKVAQLLSRPAPWKSLAAHAVALALELGPMRRRLLRQSILSPARLLADPDAFRQLALDRAAPPHHVSSTCRMGRRDDPGAVVDPACRVSGIAGLRVVDASVMPTLVRTNTHIPVIMMAEKMAQAIRDER